MVKAILDACPLRLLGVELLLYFFKFFAALFDLAFQLKGSCISVRHQCGRTNVRTSDFFASCTSLSSRRLLLFRSNSSWLSLSWANVRDAVFSSRVSLSRASRSSTARTLPCVFLKIPSHEIRPPENETNEQSAILF